MISVHFDQSELGGPGKTVLPSMALGGVYAAVLGGVVSPGGGAGSIVVQLDWTDMDGRAASLQADISNVSVSGGFRQTSTNLTLAHPSDLTVRIVNQGSSGNFDVDVHVYVSRMRDEGND